mgnify:CR=1 FL=1
MTQKLLHTLATGLLLSVGTSMSGQLLFDNGPYFNSTGTGNNGANESVLYTTTFGMGTIGFGHQQTAFNHVADDFIVTDCYWNIDSVAFYAYQTGSPITSTITGIYFRIWDGVPDAPGSNVVYGDTVTNRLTRTSWSGAYRITETTTGNTQRPIMRSVCSTAGLSLPAGTYWLDWSCTGTLASGPWAPPRTPVMQAVTGNARQRIGNTWNNLLDGGTNTPAQGLPFQVYGQALNATASAGTDLTVCDTASVVIGGTPSGTGQGQLTYAWLPTAGLTSATIANPTANINSSAAYVLLVTDALGCEARDTVQITVNNSQFSSISPTACGTYTSPGGNVYTSSATFTDTIASSNGCDSIISVNLTIVPIAQVTWNITECTSSYTSPSGNTYTSPGTYVDTLNTTQGCDSIITINLNFAVPTTNTIAVTSCDTYTAPSGMVYTASGSYLDTIQNTAGCDSVITINLTINTATTSQMAVSTCDASYTAPSGAVYTSSGVYTDTIANSLGCDSLITINITFNSATSDSVTVTVCDFYTAPSGAIYSASGIFNDTIVNSNGCDSIVVITLTVNAIDTGLTLTQTFEAMSEENASNATYQWLHCDNNFQPVPGATSQAFLNTYVIGNFAVAVTVGNCTDTSACIFLTAVGVEEYLNASLINVYPNPSAGIFTLDLSATSGPVTLVVTDVTGRVVETVATTGASTATLQMEQPAGMYFLQIRTSQGIATKTLIKSE